MPSAVSPRLPRLVCALILAALVLALGFQLVTARRQREVIELMRAENRLLDQENRLLRQHLEAERLQSAALTRLLQGTAGRPVPAATGP